MLVGQKLYVTGAKNNFEKFESHKKVLIYKAFSAIWKTGQKIQNYQYYQYY